MPQLLVVDDNPLDRKIVQDLLTHDGFDVRAVGDGQGALRALYECRPDLVVLDVMMPGMDGWTVCGRIRDLCDVPIILLTSLDREEEMVRGLDLGADDFVSKPISGRHLIARVRAVLRRAAPRQAAASPDDIQDGQRYDDGQLAVDEATHVVRLDGARIEMTPTEFRLLLALVSRPNRVREYGELLSVVWGPEYRDDIDFLRVYVWRLRKKLHGPGGHDWISTERGFGYRFVPWAPAA